MINTISSYEILTKIFILSQNPEVRFVSREFYEISTLNAVRVNFLLKKLGKDRVLEIQNDSFIYFPNLFEKQELAVELLKKEATPELKSKQELFNISIRRGWGNVVRHLLYDFVETTEGEFQTTFENRVNMYKFERTIKQQKDLKYYIPAIDINCGYGRLFEQAISNKNADIVKQLSNAHRIKPKLDCDESKTEILTHSRVCSFGLKVEKLCDLFEQEGVDLLKIFYVNRVDQLLKDSIFAEFCKRGNLEFVKFFVENGVYINGYYDDNPLRLACENNQRGVVKYLIKMGADTSKYGNLKSFLSSQNINSDIANSPVKKKIRNGEENKYTPQEASSNGYLDVVKKLVKNGANIHENNEIALKEASENGHLDVVKYLVENGADIHAEQDWSLGMACKSGYLDVVKYLVQKGANVQAREDFALGIACRNQRFDIVKYLVENGASLKAENYWNQIFKDNNKHLDVVDYLIERGLNNINYAYSIMSRASQNYRFDIVEFLVKNGACVDPDDCSTLEWASGNGYYDIVKYLVENGANIHANNGEALGSAIFFGHLKVAKYLVENGADIRTNIDFALKRASEIGQLEVVRYLIENGADVHANNEETLGLASGKGHLDVVKCLVESGADIHANDNVALIWASGNGYYDIVKYLVENGANIHAKNDYALASACYYGHLKVVKYLVEKGANIHTENDRALRWASEKGHKKIVKYLKQEENNILRTHNYGFQPQSIQTRDILVGKLLEGEYKVPIFKLHVSNDMMPIIMLLDTASFLIGIVATRARIIDDSIAQHALLNQRPMMGSEPLARRSGVERWVIE
ncbi:hypothetical protein BB559_006626 [Furculomyces boomerangus]|uniref:Uncharacterized protein n=1 Tax=Furculomyces boomerangus TaxID=61424 RepID=A0A2T9Y1G9_9FUNG|nr:hypothetical protein BB559_006626 [Furculomyces boomerangus]